MARRQVMKIKGLPWFELSNRPWFGPTSRARSMLDASRQISSPAETLHALKHHLGPLFRHVQFVRFVDFEHKHGRLTIAILWTASDPNVRQQVFSDAKSLVDATGWYPIGQGERLGSVDKWAAAKSWGRQLDESELGLHGSLRSISAAVPPEDGCSVRVVTDNGAILLDSGLPDRIQPLESDRLLLLTHTHSDHAGGLTSGRLGNIKTVMSTGTAQLLLASSRLSRDDLRSNVTIVEPGERLEIGPSLNAEAFAVPHMPGSVGYVIRDKEQSLLFTGDLCLETARHSYTAALMDRIRQETRPTTLLLDATMAGRPHGASLAPAAESALKRSDQSDLVLVGDGGDRLLYAYLDLFSTLLDTGGRHSRSFVVSGELRPLMQAAHAAFIRGEGDRLDPFISAQYGRSRASWGESRWLYWLDNLTSIPPGPVVWLVTGAELAEVDTAVGTPFVNLGRSDSCLDARAKGWIELEDLDRSAWTLHSNESTLRKSIDELSATGARVVMFHNFSKRLRRFIRDSAVQAEALSGNVPLRIGVEGGPHPT